MSKKKICVILPCYRVKHKIYHVYKKLIKLKINKIIFVDDYCPENSVQYLKSKIKKTKKMQFVFLNKNNGVGGATLKGFKIAAEQGFDILLKFDSDNQHKVKDLTKIIQFLQDDDVLFCKGYRNLNLNNSFRRKIDISNYFIREIKFLKTTGIHVPEGIILHENVDSLNNLKKIENHTLFNHIREHFITS